MPDESGRALEVGLLELFGCAADEDRILGAEGAGGQLEEEEASCVKRDRIDAESTASCDEESSGRAVPDAPSEHRREKVWSRRSSLACVEFLKDSVSNRIKRDAAVWFESPAVVEFDAAPFLAKVAERQRTIKLVSSDQIDFSDEECGEESDGRSDNDDSEWNEASARTPDGSSDVVSLEIEECACAEDDRAQSGIPSGVPSLDARSPDRPPLRVKRARSESDVLSRRVSAHAESDSSEESSLVDSDDDRERLEGKRRRFLSDSISRRRLARNSLLWPSDLTRQSGIFQLIKETQVCASPRPSRLAQPLSSSLCPPPPSTLFSESNKRHLSKLQASLKLSNSQKLSSAVLFQHAYDS